MIKGMFAHAGMASVLSRVSLRQDEPYTLVVSGVPRGGTSMAAAVIHELGVDLGPVGFNYEDPHFLSEDRAALEAYVAERNETRARWGFKLPDAHAMERIASLPFRSPIWAFVLRNPVSNADSLVARGDPDIDFALRRLLASYAAMSPYFAEGRDFIAISYERAVQDPNAFVSALSAALLLAPDDATAAQAARQISGDGAGYVPPSGARHFVRITPAEDGARGAALERRPAEDRSGVAVAFEDRAPRSSQRYLLRGGRPGLFVTIILDFGEGFSALAAYDLLMPGSEAVVEVEHEGAVAAVGFGARLSETPDELVIERES